MSNYTLCLFVVQFSSHASKSMSFLSFSPLPSPLLFSSPLLPPFLLLPPPSFSLLRMSFIQTSVPLVFWGQCPPSHEIACICRSEEKRGVATASRSGQICIWDVCKERETEKVRVGPSSILTHAPFASHKAKAGLFLLRH